MTNILEDMAINNFEVFSVHGNSIDRYTIELAELRTTVFKEYPYLYSGNIEEEMRYLSTYTSCPESIAIFIKENNAIIGASTAIPLQSAAVDTQKPFIDNSHKLSEYLYLGESVLLPDYRGKGLYKHFFKHREDHARKMGCTKTTFCAIERDTNDPRQPKGYVDLSQKWNHFGYNKENKLQTKYEWTETEALSPSVNSMIFWVKSLL